MIGISIHFRIGLDNSALGYQRLEMEDEMNVGDCMKREIVSVTTKMTVKELVQVAIDNRVGTFPVVDEANKLVGVIGLRELVALTIPDFVNLLEDIDFVCDFGAVKDWKPSEEDLSKTADQLMRETIHVNEDCSLIKAVSLMRKHAIQDLIIISEEHDLVGIASRVDVRIALIKSWNVIQDNNDE